MLSTKSSASRNMAFSFGQVPEWVNKPATEPTSTSQATRDSSHSGVSTKSPCCPFTRNYCLWIRQQLSSRQLLQIALTWLFKLNQAELGFRTLNCLPTCLLRNSRRISIQDIKWLLQLWVHVWPLKAKLRKWRICCEMLLWWTVCMDLQSQRITIKSELESP